MSEHILKTIADIEHEIKQIEESLKTKKRMVNDLCQMINHPARYSIIDQESRESSVFNIRPDQFFARPLATVVKEYLQMRKASNLGAASLQEIHDALVQGGFQFEKPKLALRGLSISITKNSSTFAKLPNDTYGLREWYPNAKNSKQVRPVAADSEESELDQQGDDSNEKSVETTEETM